MKTSVSSYSFQYLLQSGQETTLSIVSKAKELGFDAIEFTDLTPPDGMSEADFAREVSAAAEVAGLPISSYTVGADLLTRDLDQEVARVKKKVDVAVILGAKLLRHDVTFTTPSGGVGFGNVVERLAEGCRRITAYAAEKGVRTMVENHGFFCQDSDRMERLVNTVAHPNFGLLVDIGNFLCVDEDPVTAVGRCAPYAFHVHIKDFIKKSGEEGCPSEGFIHTRGGHYIRGTIIGHGVVPCRQCVSALKRAGYDGYLTLEFEGLERSDEALRQGAAYLKMLAAL